VCHVDSFDCYHQIKKQYYSCIEQLIETDILENNIKADLMQLKIKMKSIIPAGPIRAKIALSWSQQASTWSSAFLHNKRKQISAYSMYDIGIRSDSILNFHATRTENTEIHYC
jgi:hypothetical protein